MLGSVSDVQCEHSVKKIAKCDVIKINPNCDMQEAHKITSKKLIHIHNLTSYKNYIYFL